MVKIAFFLSDYPVLSETFVLRQIRGMIDLGHEVTVVTGNLDAEVPDPFKGRVSVKEIRVNGKDKRHIAAAAARLIAARIIRPRSRSVVASSMALRHRYPAPLMDIASVGARHLGTYDAIVAHFGPAGVRAMFLRDAGLIAGPIATVFHGLDMTSREIVARQLPHYKRLFRDTELLLPISYLWRDRLFDWGAPQEKIVVHRMGVDLGAIDEEKLSRPLKLPLRLISVGRLVEKKGLEFAIKAVRSVPDADYTIIGAGPLHAGLEHLAVDVGSAGAIHLLGKRPHNEVLRLLRDADVFLLPSVTAANGDMEGVPVSLMEAMADGVVAVATKHSGIPELIESGKEGMLVPERDTDGLAATLNRLANNEVDVPAMRRAARAKVEREFDNRKLDVRLEQLLLDLSNGRAVSETQEQARVH